MATELELDLANQLVYKDGLKIAYYVMYALHGCLPCQMTIIDSE